MPLTPSINVILAEISVISMQIPAGKLIAIGGAEDK